MDPISIRSLTIDHDFMGITWAKPLSASISVLTVPLMDTGLVVPASERYLSISTRIGFSI